jgi:hypothetical protein
MDDRRGRQPGLAKCEREQARAQKREAGYSHREESGGHEVTITQGHTFRTRYWSEFIKDFGIGFLVKVLRGAR